MNDRNQVHHMKIAQMLLLGSALVFTTATPLWAQNQLAPADTTNISVAEPEGGAPAKNGGDSVRIDETGIHVGGEDRVDINIPNWVGRGGLLLPIVSVLAVFGGPVAILGLFFYFR